MGVYLFQAVAKAFWAKRKVFNYFRGDIKRRNNSI